MNKLNVGIGLLLVTCSLGCRQGVNPNGPMAPMNLLNPQMRVPPPSTGSYSIPGGYYQGQASNSVPQSNVANNNDMIGSGLAQASNNSFQQSNSSQTRVASAQANPQVSPKASSSPSTSPTPMPAWTDYSPRYSTVQPAGYSTDASQPPTSGLVPVANNSGTYGPTTSPTDAGLRPQLRGMEVVDLTRVDKPANELTTQPQSNSTYAPQTPSTGELQPATRTDSASLPWRDPLQ